MGSEVLALRYAQAMVEVADEMPGASEAMARDLDAFMALMDRDGRQLGAALESPVFTVEERRAVLEQLLPKLGLHPLTANLIRLVNDKRRFPQLHDIADAFRDLTDERAGRARVTVQTAQALSPELEGEVRTALEKATGKTLILTTEVRPELIGGLVAKIGDKVYDSSLRTRLDQIKQALLRAPIAVA
ncbi:MAG: ATP synthase F1 subunit delta [Alphaproteobacteria bacterium]|nr:ATP synthase F1 subunit delta [Alphaproteobacteria bacterium]